MGHITRLPFHVLEHIFSIYTTGTPHKPVKPFVFRFGSAPPANPTGSFERHLATLAACCRKFASVSRRLLWRELSILFRSKEGELRKRQMDAFLSIVESYTSPTSATPALERGEGIEVGEVGEVGEGIGFVENGSVSTATPCNDHAAEAILSAVQTLNIEVGGDENTEWLGEVLPRLFSVLGTRILRLKIDIKYLGLPPKKAWVLDVLFHAIEAISVDPRASKALQRLEVLWPYGLSPTPVQVNLNRFTNILARKFFRLQQLSLSNVRPVDPASENWQDPTSDIQRVSGTFLPDWLEATAPTLQSLHLVRSDFNEAALSVLARLSKNLRELVLRDTLGPLTSNSVERLLNSNEELHKLEVQFPYFNSNDAKLKAVWPREVKKYDILAALALCGRSLRVLCLRNLDALGSCWEESTTVAVPLPRIIQPFEASVTWINLVSLRLCDLPCFPGRMLELLAMAINAKPDFRFPLKELYFGPCPRVGSEEVKALLRVSPGLRNLRLFDIPPNASTSTHTSSTNFTPTSKILVDDSVLDVIAESCPHLDDILFNNCTRISEKASVMNVIRSCRELTDLMFQGFVHPLLVQSIECEQPDIAVSKGWTPNSFLITATGPGLKNVRNRMAGME
ncbi:hypothetical protein HK102_004048 [Quaeritorhiza haematococci]|nr:hypothetical protein HK102_004048 [Quaeritorhiza haematococci]